MAINFEKFYNVNDKSDIWYAYNQDLQKHEKNNELVSLSHDELIERIIRLENRVTELENATN